MSTRPVRAYSGPAQAEAGGSRPQRGGLQQSGWSRMTMVLGYLRRGGCFTSGASQRFVGIHRMTRLLAVLSCPSLLHL